MDKKVPAYHPFPGLYRVCPDADTYKLAGLEISGKQDDTQRRRDGSRIGLAGDPKTLYCTHPARTVLAGTGVARHSWYCLLVFRHTETKDPQAQPDMSKCNRETLREIPLHELVKDTKRLTESERKETELKTAYIRIYRCSACSEEVKIRIPLEKDVYECCPSCGQMTLHKKEKYRTIIKATTLSEGLMEAHHRCMHCDAEYMVGYTIPKISTSSSRSGGSGGGGGSFGGGSSGGGGSSSRF